MKIRDLTGQRFGKLTALKLSTKRYKNGGCIWICKCDCGKITNVRSSHLASKETLSCGCLHGKKVQSFWTKNRKKLIGKKFGRLTIIKFLNKKDNHNRPVLCKCSCGAEKIIRYGHLANKNSYWAVKSCGCLKNEMHGDKHYRWEKDRKKLKTKVKLKSFMHNTIHQLKICKNSRRSADLLGHTWFALKKHLEKQFTAAMSWKNQGTYWVIDHKIPINYYLAQGIQDPKIVNRLDNLQPMEKIANIQKSDKLIYNVMPLERIA
jgi:hypothetical protein